MSIRKKLGQNFLNSKSIAKFIVDSAKISKTDNDLPAGQSSKNRLNRQKRTENHDIKTIDKIEPHQIH